MSLRFTSGHQQVECGKSSEMCSGDCWEILRDLTYYQPHQPEAGNTNWTLSGDWLFCFSILMSLICDSLICFHVALIKMRRKFHWELHIFSFFRRTQESDGIQRKWQQQNKHKKQDFNTESQHSDITFHLLSFILIYFPNIFATFDHQISLAISK